MTNASVTLVDYERGNLTSLQRGALFVVLSIGNTVQPSGQSACLQAMVCGKAVILSDIEGLWDRDVMQDNHNCVLVAPENPLALSGAISNLLNDAPHRVSLGHAARITIEQHFNTDRMASHFRDLVTAGADSRCRKAESEAALGTIDRN